MLGFITRRRILYWLAAMAAGLVVGTIIGLIWADTSDVAGSIEYELATVKTSQDDAVMAGASQRADGGGR